MKAKIRRVDKAKEDVILELLEATFTLPITVHADYVKLVEKHIKEKPQIFESSELKEEENEPK